MLENARPQPGDVYLELNGRDAYVEIPSIADYSISTTGELTISAWLRPGCASTSPPPKKTRIIFTG